MLVVHGMNIKKYKHMQLLDTSCSGPPGLGPNKMNLCLNVQMYDFGQVLTWINAV